MVEAAGKRGVSLRPFKDELARLEARRLQLGVSVSDWAMQAGISFPTVNRARSSGKAKPGTIKALRSALRSLKIQRQNLHMFEVHDDA